MITPVTLAQVRAGLPYIDREQFSESFELAITAYRSIPHLRGCGIAFAWRAAVRGGGYVRIGLETTLN